jgi:hypothetical protein
MKNYINIFILVISYNSNFYAAEEKTEAARAMFVLPPRQAPVIRRYTEQQKAKFAQEIQRINSAIKPAGAQHTLLTYAIEYGYTQLTPYLIVTQPHLITKLNGYGETPLHLAVRKNNVPTIELLLTHGAAINAKNTQDYTPIFMASTKGVMKFLLDHGADLSIKTKQGESLIHRVLNNGTWQGVDSSITANFLNLILESPQLQFNPSLKKQLLNEPNSHGIKPLCQAAVMKWTKIAELFITHGADCTDERYKDFLVPLIKEVEAERAKTTFDVLRGAKTQEQKLPKPVANIVREYIEGEQKTGAAESATSTPATSSETEVGEVD